MNQLTISINRIRRLSKEEKEEIEKLLTEKLKAAYKDLAVYGFEWVDMPVELPNIDIGEGDRNWSRAMWFDEDNSPSEF